MVALFDGKTIGKIEFLYFKMSQKHSRHFETILRIYLYIAPREARDDISG